MGAAKKLLSEPGPYVGARKPVSASAPAHEMSRCTATAPSSSDAAASAPSPSSDGTPPGAAAASAAPGRHSDVAACSSVCEGTKVVVSGG